MSMSSWIRTVVMMAAPATACAGPGTNFVPEPGVFGLLAIGGVAAVVIAIRNRRRK